MVEHHDSLFSVSQSIQAVNDVLVHVLADRQNAPGMHVVEHESIVGVVGTVGLARRPVIQVLNVDVELGHAVEHVAECRNVEGVPPGDHGDLELCCHRDSRSLLVVGWGLPCVRTRVVCLAGAVYHRLSIMVNR
jgi:hypothetical protein